MAFQNVFVAGATWAVGSELVKQIEEKDGVDQGHNNPTRIIGVWNSKGFLLDSWGVENATELVKTGLDGVMQEYGDEESHGPRLTQVFQAAAKLGLKWDVVFVDATWDKSAEMKDAHLDIVQARSPIVTINKNPLSLFPFEDFKKLSGARHLYGYNATVMAWGDSVPQVIAARDTRDKIRSIKGCFSGTLGYISSELDTWEKPFSQIVREAFDKWYTEPHPHDDLNGLDVARKLLILARTAGYEVDMDDIELIPFVPKEYGTHTDPDGYMDAIAAEDERIANMFQEAKNNNQRVRFVAEMTVQDDGTVKLFTGLKNVDADEPLGRLEGAANLFQMVADDAAPEDCPHVITSKWAGTARTAARARANLLQFLGRYSDF